MQQELEALAREEKEIVDLRSHRLPEKERADFSAHPMHTVAGTLHAMVPPSENIARGVGGVGRGGGHHVPQDEYSEERLMLHMLPPPRSGKGDAWLNESHEDNAIYEHEQAI